MTTPPPDFQFDPIFDPGDDLTARVRRVRDGETTVSLRLESMLTAVDSANPSLNAFHEVLADSARATAESDTAPASRSCRSWLLARSAAASEAARFAGLSVTSFLFFRIGDVA